MKKYRNPDSIHPPFGYTQIVESGAGRTIYISGQVAFDIKGNVVGADDARAQAEQVFTNLSGALEAAGATFRDVVKTNAYVVDMAHLSALREVRARYLDREHPPASTTVAVKSLVRPDLLIEVDAVAVVE